MDPRSTSDPTDAEAVFARVMAEQPDAIQPARPSSDAVLAKAPDVAGPKVTGPQHQGVTGGDGPQGHGGQGGQDGKDIEDGVAGYLDYLSQLAQQLGVPDPVEEYFAPVVGRWSEMHNEAERWRAAAKTADEATQSLTKPLGSLDSAWRGKDADAFVHYMGKMGLAGNDLSDAMGGMAKALDKTANSIRQIVQQMAGMLADTAENTSQAMTVPAKGDNRVRMHLDESRRPTKELFDSVRQVLEAFVKLCDGIEGGASFDKIEMKHTFPEQNFQFPDQRVNSPKIANTDGATHASGSDDTGGKHAAGGSSGGSGGGGGGSAGVTGGGGGGSAGGHGSSTPAEKPTPGGYTGADESSGTGQGAAAAASTGAGAGGGAGGQGQGRGGGGFGGMPMMGGMGGAGQGGDQEHKRSARVVGDPTDIFGRPTKTSPSVIGEDE